MKIKIGDGSTAYSSLPYAVNFGANVPVATKLGTSTVGSATKHMYISSGTPTASSSTVGSSSTPIYMSSGTFTACSSFFTSLITTKDILAISAISNLFTFSSNYTYFIFIAYYLENSNTYKEFLSPVILPYSGLSNEVMICFPGYGDSFFVSLSCNTSSGNAAICSTNSDKLYFADILGLQI